ncbi:hypothetical protein CSKR_102987 [Clonorchis sinensis]|uniref:Uncharacterized protein n=1 Tax=Clonorchis sinensis TaxID=79923 RepID=A0A3R7GXK5_CLOSI|nr:hypothetical protein CSKR_102987 [Clonorchis sinensis]
MHQSNSAHRLKSESASRGHVLTCSPSGGTSGEQPFILRNTLICKQIWFCERLTWDPTEPLVCDVSRQLNVLYQAASCFCWDDIRDIAIHV